VVGRWESTGGGSAGREAREKGEGTMSTLTVKVLESDLRCLEPLMPETLEVRNILGVGFRALGPWVRG
jgi:hypothetical protein